MAVGFCDSFDNYAATSDLTKKWGTASSPWTFSTTAGRDGGGGVTCIAGSSNGSLRSPQFIGGATSGTIHLGFYLQLASATVPGAQTGFISFLRSDTGTAAGGFQLTAAGQLLLLTMVNTSAGLSSSAVINDGKWHWIECRVNMANSSQTQTLHIDSVQQYSSSTNVGQGAPFGGIIFNQMDNNGIACNGLDDIIVYDDNGNSPKDSDYPLGPRKITTIRPNSDSAVQFTKNTGATNNSALSETNPDGDTTYVEDGSNGEQDLYGFPSLGFTPTAINGVMENIYVENPFGGTINHTQICKNSSTQTNGTSTITPSGYATKQQFFGLDPNTTAAWTKAGLDSALFGFLVG